MADIEWDECDFDWNEAEQVVITASGSIPLTDIPDADGEELKWWHILFASVPFTVTEECGCYQNPGPYWTEGHLTPEVLRQDYIDCIAAQGE